MTELLQRAINEMMQLSEQEQNRFAAWILERLAAQEAEDENEWEERMLVDSLGDALKPDGTLDFDKLRERGTQMTLEEFYPEGDDSNGP